MGKEKNGSAETLGLKSHLKGMGRDEMNLAEFPLAMLGDQVPQGCKTLVFEDRIWDRGQKEHVVRRLTISGSDKFGIYAASAELTRGMVHLKTAGTSYLEALRVVARLNPSLLRAIYGFSRRQYETDRASYHVSARLDAARASRMVHRPHF